MGIRVNTIAPGIMDTPMLAGSARTGPGLLGQQVLFPKRLGTPEEYAEARLLPADPRLHERRDDPDGWRHPHGPEVNAGVRAVGGWRFEAGFCTRTAPGGGRLTAPQNHDRIIRLVGSCLRWQTSSHSHLGS